MRILSQGGMIFNDIPYEKFCLGIVRDRTTDKFCVVAKERMISESGFKLEDVMAEYSTEDKARKAMEMLQNTYCESELSKISNDGITFLTTHFQFPKDNEVEV